MTSITCAHPRITATFPRAHVKLPPPPCQHTGISPVRNSCCIPSMTPTLKSDSGDSDSHLTLPPPLLPRHPRWLRVISAERVTVRLTRRYHFSSCVCCEFVTRCGDVISLRRVEERPRRCFPKHAETRQPREPPPITPVLVKVPRFCARRRRI